MTKTKLLVQGWRGISHSYAMVNQYHLRELRKRPQIALSCQDLPFFDPQWSRNVDPDLFGDELNSIPSPDGAQDIVYRIAYPYRAYADKGGKVFCQATCEYRHLIDAAPFLPGPGGVTVDPATHFITPSRWSKQGLVNSGLAADQIHVVPHGIDPAIFHPLPAEQRAEIRRRNRLSDRFIFLNVGMMADNKGIDILLLAFAEVRRRHSHAMLALKDARGLYGRDAVSVIQRTRSNWPGRLDNLSPDCVHVIGDNLDLPGLRQLYGTCDAYVSPYRAEAFNLPPLEAAACGLPIAVTSGGATDEYSHESFALRIASREASQDGRSFLEPDLDSLVDIMLQLIERRASQLDQGAGLRWLHENFTWSHTVDTLLAAFNA